MRLKHPCRGKVTFLWAHPPLSVASPGLPLPSRFWLHANIKMGIYQTLIICPRAPCRKGSSRLCLAKPRSLQPEPSAKHRVECFAIPSKKLAVMPQSKFQDSEMSAPAHLRPGAPHAWPGPIAAALIRESLRCASVIRDPDASGSWCTTYRGRRSNFFLFFFRFWKSINKRIAAAFICAIRSLRCSTIEKAREAVLNCHHPVSHWPQHLNTPGDRTNIDVGPEPSFSRS